MFDHLRGEQAPQLTVLQGVQVRQGVAGARFQAAGAALLDHPGVDVDAAGRDLPLPQQVQELSPAAADVEHAGRAFEERQVLDQPAADLVPRAAVQVLEADVGIGVGRIVERRLRRRGAGPRPVRPRPVVLLCRAARRRVGGGETFELAAQREEPVLHLADRGPQLVDLPGVAPFPGHGRLRAPAHLVAQAVEGAHRGARHARDLVVLRVHERGDPLHVLHEARLEGLERGGVLAERRQGRGQGLLSLRRGGRRAVEVVDQDAVEVLLALHDRPHESPDEGADAPFPARAQQVFHVGGHAPGLVDRVELPLVERPRRAGQGGPRRQRPVDPGQGVVVGSIRGFARLLQVDDLVLVADAAGHARRG